MKRRELLKLGALAATACGGAVDEEGADDVIKPWHMWGNTVTVPMTNNTANPSGQQSVQVVKIDYKRPESWRFFMQATLSEIDGPNLVGSLVTVGFDLTIGVGRSQVTIPNFVFLSFDPAAVAPFYVTPFTKWAGSGLEPARTPAATQRVIDVVPAQSIQLQANCTLQPGGAGVTNANINVSAYFAPETHIRPDWFERVGRFNGDETGGS